MSAVSGGSSPRTVVVVGNPKPASRTLDAALLLHRELVGREPDLAQDVQEVVDVEQVRHVA